MRSLEHAISGARAALRRASARTGGTDPARVRPARLVLRLDDGDLDGVMGDGDELSLAQWFKLLTSAVTWLGSLPVTVIAQRAGAHPYLHELVRFAHRLECETLVVTDGAGIDRARAEELIDCGMASVRVWVGGVSEGVHGAVVGSALSDATGAVAALVAARADRGAPLDIEVGVPWQGPVATELRAVIGWAREAGADGVRVVAPWRARDMPGDPELLDAIIDEGGAFHRTSAASVEELHAMVASQDGEPGLARAGMGFRRRRFPCPVGGQRLEVTANGLLYSCPFKAPIGVFAEDLRADWGAAGPHLSAIHDCARACAHVELAPQPILG